MLNRKYIIFLIINMVVLKLHLKLPDDQTLTYTLSSLMILMLLDNIFKCKELYGGETNTQETQQSLLGKLNLKGEQLSNLINESFNYVILTTFGRLTNLSVNNQNIIAKSISRFKEQGKLSRFTYDTIKDNQLINFKESSTEFNSQQLLINITQYYYNNLQTRQAELTAVKNNPDIAKTQAELEVLQTLLESRKNINDQATSHHESLNKITLQLNETTDPMAKSNLSEEQHTLMTSTEELDNKLNILNQEISTHRSINELKSQSKDLDNAIRLLEIATDEYNKLMECIKDIQTQLGSASPDINQIIKDALVTMIKINMKK